MKLARRRIALGLFALGIAGIAASCAQPVKARLFGPAEPLSPADYSRVLNTWTRSDRLYHGLNNKMFVSATFHAPEFRRAFAAAWPDVYGHGGEVTRRELVDLSGDVEEHHTFFVAMYTPDAKWNDLEQADSIWRLNLVSSNEVAVSPSAVERVKVDANLRAVYPYIGRFDECYLVRFPLTDMTKRIAIDPSTTRFSLRIASALGASEMHWDLIATGTEAAAQDAPPPELDKPVNAGD